MYLDNVSRHLREMRIEMLLKTFGELNELLRQMDAPGPGYWTAEKSVPTSLSRYIGVVFLYRDHFKDTLDGQSMKFNTGNGSFARLASQEVETFMRWLIENRSAL